MMASSNHAPEPDGTGLQDAAAGGPETRRVGNKVTSCVPPAAEGTWTPPTRASRRTAYSPRQRQNEHIHAYLNTLIIMITA